MIRDSSRREVPRISSDLISRSDESEGSPASILAMRDSLDWYTGSRRWREAEIDILPADDALRSLGDLIG